MVKTCRARDGERFQVDDVDYPIVSALRWSVKGWYDGKGGAVQTQITLARLLLLKELAVRLHEDPTAQVDHINGNPFDNRRKNLRVVSASDNNHYKWKRMALARIRRGIKCAMKCPNKATSAIHLPSKRYLYVCAEHFVTTKRKRIVD